MASGICNIFAVAGMSIASFLFPRLLTWVGFGPTFWFYAGVTLVGTVYIFAVMPESKGRSLTDMEEHFDNSNNSKKRHHGDNTVQEKQEGTVDV